MDVTTATPDELKRLYDHIALQMNDDRFFTTKELALLPKIMSPDEWLYGFSSGYMNNSTWLIVLTSKRVIFLDKHLLWGHDETSIGLGKINSVQKKSGIMFGNIVLHDGSREYAIRNVWKKSIIPFTNRLDQAIEEFERSARSGVPIPPPVYPWDIAPQPSAPDPWEPAPPFEHNREPGPAAEAPTPPVAGPLRDYLNSLPDAAPPHPIGATDAPAAMPSHLADQVEPAAVRARLDRLRNAGAIGEAEYERQIQALVR
ncbi:PH domain-containing protein [Sphingomonas sp. 3-13AW]|uniref:PH domain-containing protein n=1 Tax=Sphingomonas sp. 3-13AW TaxID=3050450 RepID=UPI003BB4A6E1